MKKTLVAMLMVFVLVFAGCSNADNPTIHEGPLDGTYEVGTITVDGQTLTCITMKRGYGQEAWGGLWCFPPDSTTGQNDPYALEP